MNLVIQSGRLTKDAETYYTTDGKAVCKFDLAVNRRFKREGEADADFHSCVVFGKLAETIDKLKIRKGTKLIVTGELRNNNFEKNGVKYYSSQIVVNNFEFCESKNAQAESVQSDNSIAEGFIPIPDSDLEKLPFA